MPPFRRNRSDRQAREGRRSRSGGNRLSVTQIFSIVATLLGMVTLPNDRPDASEASTPDLTFSSDEEGSAESSGPSTPRTNVAQQPNITILYEQPSHRSRRAERRSSNVSSRTRSGRDRHGSGSTSLGLYGSTSLTTSAASIHGSPSPPPPYVPFQIEQVPLIAGTPSNVPHGQPQHGNPSSPEQHISAPMQQQSGGSSDSQHRFSPPQPIAHSPQRAVQEPEAQIQPIPAPAPNVDPRVRDSSRPTSPSNASHGNSLPHISNNSDAQQPPGSNQTSSDTRPVPYNPMPRPLQRQGAFYGNSHPHIFYHPDAEHSPETRPYAYAQARLHPLRRQDAFYGNSHPEIFHHPDADGTRGSGNTARTLPSVSTSTSASRTNIRRGRRASESDQARARRRARELMASEAGRQAVLEILDSERNAEMPGVPVFTRIAPTSEWRRDPDWEGGVIRNLDERTLPEVRPDDGADSQGGEFDFSLSDHEAASRRGSAAQAPPSPTVSHSSHPKRKRTHDEQSTADPSTEVRATRRRRLTESPSLLLTASPTSDLHVNPDPSAVLDPLADIPPLRLPSPHIRDEDYRPLEANNAITSSQVVPENPSTPETTRQGPETESPSIRGRLRSAKRSRDAEDEDDVQDAESSQKRRRS